MIGFVSGEGDAQRGSAIELTGAARIGDLTTVQIEYRHHQLVMLDIGRSLLRPPIDATGMNTVAKRVAADRRCIPIEKHVLKRISALVFAGDRHHRPLRYTVVGRVEASKFGRRVRHFG